MAGVGCGGWVGWITSNSVIYSCYIKPVTSSVYMGFGLIASFPPFSIALKMFLLYKYL